MTEEEFNRLKVGDRVTASFCNISRSAIVVAIKGKCVTVEFINPINFKKIVIVKTVYYLEPPTYIKTADINYKELRLIL